MQSEQLVNLMWQLVDSDGLLQVTSNKKTENYAKLEHILLTNITQEDFIRLENFSHSDHSF